VYAVEKGLARIRAVELGRRNGAQAQIAGGLRDGEPVVVYPGDNVVDGAKVKGR
jgi:HlyD family secretion protein